MRNNKDLKNLVSEIKSLEKDLEEYKKGIQKIKDAPLDKDADVVGPQHKELITELEDISKKLEALPNKWGEELDV